MDDGLVQYSIFFYYWLTGICYYLGSTVTQVCN